MKDDPAKKIFAYQHKINDYRRDTGDLTFEQHGAYRQLLDCYYLQGGFLPSDLKKLYRLTGAQKRSERHAVAYAVARFFHNSSVGFLTQNGAEKELTHITKLSTANRHKANSRWLKHKDTSDAAAYAPAHAAADATAMPSACKPSTINQVEEKESSLTHPIPVLEGPPGFSIFWSLFPPQRRGNRQKALDEYCRILTSHTATEREIHEGTRRYAASDEITRGLFSRADNWLNRENWKNPYEPAAVSGTHGDVKNGNAGGRQRPASIVEAGMRVADRYRDDTQS